MVNFTDQLRPSLQLSKKNMHEMVDFFLFTVCIVNAYRLTYESNDHLISSMSTDSKNKVNQNDQCLRNCKSRQKKKKKNVEQK